MSSATLASTKKRRSARVRQVAPAEAPPRAEDIRSAAPAAETPTAQPGDGAAQPSGAGAGRDTKGKFVAGNCGGPGNPFARKCAELRSAMMEAVTPQDMKDIIYAIVFKARCGDLAAAKILLPYVLGKAAPAVNPDTIDIEEFQQIYAPRQQIWDKGQEQMNALEPRFVSHLVRVFNEICRAQFGKMLEASEHGKVKAEDFFPWMAAKPAPAAAPADDKYDAEDDEKDFDDDDDNLDDDDAEHDDPEGTEVEDCGNGEAPSPIGGNGARASHNANAGPSPNRANGHAVAATGQARPTTNDANGRTVAQTGHARPTTNGAGPTPTSAGGHSRLKKHRGKPPSTIGGNGRQRARGHTKQL
jgi:hypothetical protein